MGALLRGLGLLAGVLLALAGPAAAAGAPVPLEVCVEDRGWRRPGVAEMAATVWRDNRYRDPATGAVDDRVLTYYTHHFLFFTFSTADGVSHALDMTGLVPDRPRRPWPPGLCTPRHDQTAGPSGDAVVWALGYRVAAADLTDSMLTLTVERNDPAGDRGYTIVRLPRPAATWQARFVLPDGREVARAPSPERAICCAEEPALDDPARDARAALVRFMDARLARDGAATLALLTDGLRARAPYGFTGLSNPCFYRYAVEAFERPAPDRAGARVRTYTHLWPGDRAGGPPRSAAEEVELVRTPAGWLVDDARPVSTWREEPAEPHGEAVSACTVGRRAAEWLPAALPAAGGLPAAVPIVTAMAGATLAVVGLAHRATGGRCAR